MKFIGFSFSVYSLLFCFFLCQLTCLSCCCSSFFSIFFLLLCRGHCPFSILLASCDTFLASALVLGVLFMREMLSNFPKTCNVCVSLSLSLSLAQFGATLVCGNYKLLFFLVMLCMYMYVCFPCVQAYKFKYIVATCDDHTNWPN